jgi:hypothetical protein
MYSTMKIVRSFSKKSQYANIPYLEILLHETTFKYAQHFLQIRDGFLFELKGELFIMCPIVLVAHFVCEEGDTHIV